ncbi:Rieske (2Fe-2S) protein [Jatrophihabitans cynanchi]|jgi:Rieske Fe-S protein|uniref:Cytochrome bc1 complex Rieske iron-sulfur subunit n=1 Tax=Jatrophihabitans cynanchi TaxID=2944128 RepID=A0ABY7K0C2_9ACTN|nr:Rieske (2Fe-2S) protein [Jatrophihabitans sp. SB3-54]WAX57037.1 Rieske (2Fe-2S) protein [Jatrophihabitans sp. SB3-54]
MDHDLVVTRRTVLAAGAAGAGSVALAACGSGGPPSAARSGAPVAAADTPLVTLADITVGEAASAKLPDGSPVIVARPTENTAACFSAICTHMGCTVAPAGRQLHCPCHGSVYDATTGQVVHGPAPRALAKVSVHVAGGRVLTG